MTAAARSPTIRSTGRMGAPRGEGRPTHGSLRHRAVLRGSLVAAVGWSAITFAFGVYIADIDGYRVTYGIFGAAIAFLLWLYLVGLVILIGAEVNALLSAAGRRSWAGASAEGTETTLRG